MITTGKPAKETQLGKQVNQKKVQLLQETRDWLRGWIPYCSNDKEFGKRYKQILAGLTAVVKKLYDEALGDFEPIQFLNNCITYCNLNPDVSQGSIKYCSLYLESIYNDIYFELDGDKAQQEMAETVSTNQRKTRKTKEQKEEEAQYKKEQENIYNKEIDVGGGSL